jgi:tRNA/rRNA methyltransferase
MNPPKSEPALSKPGVSPDAGERGIVILARPRNPENIGLVARAMKNTGFAELRLVGLRQLGPAAFTTAVHAEEILDRAGFFDDVASAVADCEAVFAATAKPRKYLDRLSLRDAVTEIRAFPPATRVGLLFGNERTGLTADELLHANRVFTISQAGRQPSYNLSAAVALTLFALFDSGRAPAEPRRDPPLPRREQEDVIRLILEKLAGKGFIHGTNRTHVGIMIHDLLGRLAMSDRDRRLLLAIFTKGVDSRQEKGEKNGR